MIRIVASARRDLDEGFEFYESQEIGLGDYFLSSVRADIELPEKLRSTTISRQTTQPVSRTTGTLALPKSGKKVSGSG
jgi:hypothetical protein